jgi:hypothetical protein
MVGGQEGNTNALKYDNEEVLKELIDKYFQECDENNKPYTMSGLAYALKIDRKTLINYGKRESFSTLVSEAKDKIQKQLEENALTGKYNAQFTMFNLKNNYGWQDKQEVEAKVDSSVDIKIELSDD